MEEVIEKKEEKTLAERAKEIETTLLQFTKDMQKTFPSFRALTLDFATTGKTKRSKIDTFGFYHVQAVKGIKTTCTQFESFSKFIQRKEKEEEWKRQ